MSESLLLAALINAVTNGIERDGYYIATAGSLALLWDPARISSLYKLLTVESFAKQHGWVADTQDNCLSVRFRPSSNSLRIS